MKSYPKKSKVSRAKCALFLGLLLFCHPAAFGQSAPVDTVRSAPGITIETAVDRAEIYIGDLIEYTMTITHDSGITLTPPPIGANLGAFDVKDYKIADEIPLEDGRFRTESHFVLTTFTTGDYVIPPIPIEFVSSDSRPRLLLSEPVPIRVKSLLAEAADTADIRDIKGPYEPDTERPTEYLVGGGILLLALVLLLLWWLRRRRRRGEIEPVDLRKPWEIAFEELAVLKEKNYPVSGEIKQFYVELTAILRGFLQRIYDTPVLDMTTDEFKSALELVDLKEELKERTLKLLIFSDLVKFAKFLPDIDKINADFEETNSLVTAIRQIEVDRVGDISSEESDDRAEVANV